MSLSGPQAALRESALEIHRYLSGELAPLMAAEAMEAFLAHPPEMLARTLGEWVQGQLRPGNAVRVSDLVYHALSKVHLVGEMDLAPKEAVARLVAGASRILVPLCPEGDRDGLRLRLSRLGEVESVAAAPAQFLQREGAAVPASAVPASVAPALQALPALPPVPAAQGGDEADRVARRFTAVLQRLASLKLPDPGPGAPAASPENAAEAEMLGQVLSALALGARTDVELDRSLERVRREGLAAPMNEIFRALGWSLAGWTVPTRGEGGEPREALAGPAARPVEAMNRIVALAPDAQERARRWGDMTYAAIEQFNAGRLAQAAAILEAARRLMEEKKPDTAIVNQVLGRAQEALSEETLRRLVESPEKHGLIRQVLSFFPAYRVEALLSALDGEPRRERRKLLMSLLECHGPSTRPVALARLAAVMGGDPPDEEGFYRRNLALLLRLLPRRENEGLEEELGLLQRMIARGAPALAAREAAAALGELKNTAAERMLAARLREMESEAAPDPEAAWAMMDRLCAALVRQGTREAIRTVARHAFLRTPGLGDPISRLEHLGRIDLSVDLEQLAALLQAVRERLPAKLLGFSLTRPSPELPSLLQALAGTPTVEVRQTLEEVVRVFGGQGIGEQASRLLAKLQPRAPQGNAGEALSGDLELFGLPNLLQTLSMGGSTGELVVFDRNQVRRGSFLLVMGKLVRGEAGRLAGSDALYQILERPFPGTFAFRTTVPAAAEATSEGLDVQETLLEGLRRHDEYQQARALAPDGIRLEPGGASAVRPEDETDVTLARAVWARAAGGTTPESCESELPADPYRIRRMYAAWIEQGALRPRTEPTPA